MIISYDIIRKNLSIIEELKAEFPNLVEYEKLLIQNNISSDEVSRKRINSLLEDLHFSGFEPYTSFIQAINRIKNPDSVPLEQLLIHEDGLKYSNIKPIICENMKSDFSDDKKIQKIFLNKSKSKFDQLFDNQRLLGRYSYNLDKSNLLIINYLIQNQVNVNKNCITSITFLNHFANELPVFDRFQLDEITITKKIVSEFSGLLDKIKEDFDWRRINFGYLNRNITSSIHEKVLTIKNGDFVKFISSKEKLPSNYNCNLTTNKTYTVDYIRMGYDNLLITIKDDENRRIELPYRYFSEITKMREDKISFLFDN